MRTIPKDDGGGTAASDFGGNMLGRSGAVGKRRRMSENGKGSRLTRDLSAAGAAGYCAEIFVQSAQQVDQHLPLVLVEARQQASLAFEGGDDHLVMGGAALGRQRDRMGAAVFRVGADRD